jgi:hypothetical protein
MFILTLIRFSGIFLLVTRVRSAGVIKVTFNVATKNMSEWGYVMSAGERLYQCFMYSCLENLCLDCRESYIQGPPAPGDKPVSSRFGEANGEAAVTAATISTASRRTSNFVYGAPVETGKHSEGSAGVRGLPKEKSGEGKTDKQEDVPRSRRNSVSGLEGEEAKKSSSVEEARQLLMRVRQNKEKEQNQP